LSPTYGELSKQLDLSLSLTGRLSHFDFYSMGKSWHKVQASENCGRLTPPWINYRVGGTLPDVAGLTGQSQMIWSKRMSRLLVRCRDIVLCQKTEK
jgi:hypothetical protein